MHIDVLTVLQEQSDSGVSKFWETMMMNDFDTGLGFSWIGMVLIDLRAVLAVAAMIKYLRS